MDDATPSAKPTRDAPAAPEAQVDEASAPVDVQRLSQAEYADLVRAKIARARADVAAGRVKPHAEVMAEMQQLCDDLQRRSQRSSEGA